MAIKRGGHGKETMVAAVEAAISDHQRDDLQIDDKSLIRKTTYNTAGNRGIVHGDGE